MKPIAARSGATIFGVLTLPCTCPATSIWSLISLSKNYCRRLTPLLSQIVLVRHSYASYVKARHVCVSVLRHNRPDYKKLGVLKQQFPDVPIIALTATATETVCQAWQPSLLAPYLAAAITWVPWHMAASPDALTAAHAACPRKGDMAGAVRPWGMHCRDCSEAMWRVPQDLKKILRISACETFRASVDRPNLFYSVGGSAATLGATPLLCLGIWSIDISFCLPRPERKR